MQNFDVIVIGAGPAGGGVATLLAQAGKKVLMVEYNGVGGVCPLRGCNPKKVLMSAPEAIAAARHLSAAGLSGELKTDWRTMQEFKDSFVSPVPERAARYYRGEGIEVIEGKASFIDENTIEIDGTQYKADTICICAGLLPRGLDIPGNEHLLTSDDFLDMPELPKRIAFIGGGFISLEFAHLARLCGSEVTIVNRSSRFLRKFDSALVDKLMDATRELGIRVLTDAPVTAVEKQQTALVLHTSGPTDRVEADAIFNCAGRVPDYDGMRIENCGIEYGPRGILVNKRMQSITKPHIYAIGDIADSPYALTPTATIEANTAAANILTPNSAEVNYSGIPSAVFTLPPLATCGMSEEDAKNAKLDFRVVDTDLADKFPWQRLGEQHAASRIIVDNRTDAILGGHILGHNAEEMINTIAMAIRNGLTATQVRETVWAYPTCTYYMKYIL